MRCDFFSSLSARLILLSCPFLLTGCLAMNGHMMNASGQGYYDKGNYSMAAREFELAVQSQPHNPDYVANLARTKYKMGDVSQS